jgi:hypothetical protein
MNRIHNKILSKFRNLKSDELDNCTWRQPCGIASVEAYDLRERSGFRFYVWGSEGALEVAKLP